jgi:hypothetical protein
MLGGAGRRRLPASAGRHLPGRTPSETLCRALLYTCRSAQGMGMQGGRQGSAGRGSRPQPSRTRRAGGPAATQMRRKTAGNKSMGYVQVWESAATVNEIGEGGGDAGG